VVINPLITDTPVVVSPSFDARRQLSGHAEVTLIVFQGKIALNVSEHRQALLPCICGGQDAHLEVPFPPYSLFPTATGLLLFRFLPKFSLIADRGRQRVPFGLENRKYDLLLFSPLPKESEGSRFIQR